MREFIHLIGRMIMQNKRRFNTRTPDHLLFEHNIKIFNQSIYFNISTVHTLLAESESNENNYQSKTQKKKNGSDVSDKKAEKAIDEKKRKAKSLTFRPEINAHDFQNKMKQVQKFLEKGATVSVKVDVTKSSEKCPETILSKIHTFVTENQISVKITKTGNVLTLFPISIDNNVSKDKDQTSKGDSRS